MDSVLNRFGRHEGAHRFGANWKATIRREGPRVARGYVIAVAAVALLTWLMLLARDELGVLNVLLAYLLLTIALAFGFGVGPALCTAVLGFLALDFLFIPPYGQLRITDSDHVLALFVYIGVAVGSAWLLARARRHAEAVARESRRTALLYELNTALIGDANLDVMLERIVERVVNVFGAAGARLLLTDDEGDLACRARYPRTLPGTITDDERDAAARVMEQFCPPADAEPDLGARLKALGANVDGPVVLAPVETPSAAIGVLEVIGDGNGVVAADDMPVLLAFASQAALALDHGRLARQAERAAVLAQSDELKTALVAAVSHELRTPLASIKASVSSLLDPAVHWTPEDEREFLEAIDEETDRLTLIVTNLLDLSRIEGGALRPIKEWYDVSELVTDITTRMQPRLAGHEFRIMVEPKLPIAYFDYVEIGQVLVNLLENAIRYTPVGSRITLGVRRAGNDIVFTLRDNGPGIPRLEQEHIFDRFYRASTAGHVAGAGIGLTISRGLVEAHGGVLTVESKPGYGAMFRFTLPINEDVADHAPAGVAATGSPA